MTWMNTHRCSSVRQVSWIRRRDHHLITLGSQTYSNDDRFYVSHSPPFKVTPGKGKVRQGKGRPGKVSTRRVGSSVDLARLGKVRPGKVRANQGKVKVILE